MDFLPKMSPLGRHVLSGNPGRRVPDTARAGPRCQDKSSPCNGSINTDITFDPSMDVDMYRPTDTRGAESASPPAYATLKQFQRVIKTRVPALLRQARLAIQLNFTGDQLKFLFEPTHGLIFKTGGRQTQNKVSFSVPTRKEMRTASLAAFALCVASHHVYPHAGKDTDSFAKLIPRGRVVSLLILSLRGSSGTVSQAEPRRASLRARILMCDAEWSSPTNYAVSVTSDKMSPRGKEQGSRGLPRRSLRSASTT